MKVIAHTSNGYLLEATHEELVNMPRIKRMSKSTKETEEKRTVRFDVGSIIKIPDNKEVLSFLQEAEGQLARIIATLETEYSPKIKKPGAVERPIISEDLSRNA